MKSTFITFFITTILLFSFTYNHAQDFIWAQQDGGSGFDTGNGISIDEMGNAYVTGSFNGTATIGDSTFISRGLQDIFIAKYDVDGNFLWAQHDGGSGLDIGQEISIDEMGNSYVTGFFEGTASIGDSTFSSSGVSWDIFIAKYDVDGNFIWAQQDGGSSNDIGIGISVDEIGNSYVTGFFAGTASIGDSTFISFGSNDIFIAKYDVDGNFIWAQHDGGGSSNGIGVGISVDEMGNAYVIGLFSGTASIGDSTFISFGLNDIFIAKYDVDGNFIWAQHDGSSGFDEGQGISLDEMGNAYVTGYFEGTASIGDSTFSSSGVSWDIFIAKYDVDGNFIWAQQDGGSSNDRGYGISVDAMGNSYVTGYFEGTASIGDSTFSSSGVSWDIFIAKYDVDGNFIWAQQDGGSGDDKVNGISVDAMGNFYITGYFNNTTTIGDSSFTSSGSIDIFIAKYGTNIIAKPIPSLGFWSIIILSLFIFIFGINVYQEKSFFLSDNIEV